MYPDREYRTIKELGAGSFGTVDLVKCDSEDIFYAKKSISDVIDILIGVRELDVLSYIRGFNTHGCIAGVHDYRLNVEDDKYFADIFLEFLPGGSLETWLNDEVNNPDRPINPAFGIRNRMREISRIIHTLNLLQKRGIYHLDVKTENVLMRKTGGMVLCDFSNYYADTLWKTNMDAPIGPQEASMYRPPEVALMRITKDTIPKADVWALGVLMLEIFGCMDTLNALDTRATNTTGKLTGLVEKLKSYQTTFQKRKKRSSGRPVRFDLPARQILKKMIPPHTTPNFGEDISDTKSTENEMVWCALFGRRLGNLNPVECFEESMRHFRLRRYEPDEEEVTMLETLFTDILPNVLNTSYGERWGMERLSEEMGRISGVSLPVDTVTEGELENIGLWERVPSPVWRERVLAFFECCEKMKITFGIKTINYPINHLLLAKAIAERAIEKMILSEEAPDTREFYDLILSAGVFLSSEFFDFIFPYQRCSWFEDKPLSKVAPYIELCAKLNMGEFCALCPSREEMEVITGARNIKL